MGRDAGKHEPPEARGAGWERAPGDHGGAGRSGSEGPAEVPGREVPGSQGIWAAMREADRLEREPVGPFPNWTWVYGTVIVYGILVIGLLVILTRVLDPGSAL